MREARVRLTRAVRRHHPYRTLADWLGSPGAHVMKTVSSLKILLYRLPAPCATRGSAPARARSSWMASIWWGMPSRPVPTG